jgi:hypothetical protein
VSWKTGEDIVPHLRCIGEIPAFDQHVGHEVREAADQIEKLRAALKVTHQSLLEFRHAQESGPRWYTRGEDGMYAQVHMWLRKGLDAINGCRGPGFQP